MAQVIYFGMIRSLTGKKEEFLDAQIVSTLLNVIKHRYGREAYVTAKKSHIIVNGENAGLRGGFRRKLASSDIVQILPVSGGG